MAKARKVNRNKPKTKASRTRTKKALGLGVGALLSGIQSEMEANEEALKTLANTIAMIPVEQISRNVEQPRTQFDEEGLAELAESIKIYGLIQPITVRLLAESSYEIISGERRWRASKRAGLAEIPAYIRVANDQELLEMALVENVQREDLNPVEVAFTYNRLMEECNLSHKELAARVGSKRGTITNYLSILRLPEEMMNAVRDREISLGHGKVLVGVTDEDIQNVMFEQITLKNLSVRATERLAKNFKDANITLRHWRVLQRTDDAVLQDFILGEIKKYQLDVAATEKLATKLNNPDFTTEHWNALADLRKEIKDTEKLNKAQDKIFELIKNKGLSVSATKEGVDRYLNPEQLIEQVVAKDTRLSDAYEREQDRMRVFFGTKGVKIKVDTKDNSKGQIVIPFDKKNDNLNTLLDLLS